MDYALYIASVFGAVALYLMMPRRGYNPRTWGTFLAAATLGGLWMVLARDLPENLGLADPTMVYYYIFSAIAIGAATRVITHTRPVYAALWFVLVVLSSTGLLLVLGAEFMAIAMVIVYAGAILVTYVFVIMLASESAGGEDADQGPEFERVAREPAIAIVACFLLLAVISSIVFQEMTPNPQARADDDQTIIRDVLSDRKVNALAERLAANDQTALAAEVVDTHKLANVERVGVDLFTSHPLALELAAVILLVALVGAVVIARQRIESEGNA